MRGALIAGGLSPWIFPLVARWLPARAAALVDSVFEATCHRIADRTLALAGAPMPLCSRCAGIFAGVALGAIVARPHFDLRAARIWLVVASALMVADVLAQDHGIHPMWHSTRLLTGAALGYVVGAALVSFGRPVAPVAEPRSGSPAGFTPAAGRGRPPRP